MTDVRALLKAKRQEARISHRYATYNPNGQLKCLACGVLIKHASAWEGHLGSKGHRLSLARLREAELREEEDHPKGQVLQPGMQNNVIDIPPKRRKLDQLVNDLPTESISGPEHIHAHDAEDSAELESEYRRFQREILTIHEPDETYGRATIVSEPELFTESLEGFTKDPTSTENSMEDQKREGEERELILDRLVEEERAQEEADMRVDHMRKRLEAVKRKRFRLLQDSRD